MYDSHKQNDAAFLLLLLCRPEDVLLCSWSAVMFSFSTLLRSLNELRVLLLESHRHSRDMEKDLNRDVRKAEWKVKEQKLQDDIKSLREKLLLLVRRGSVSTWPFFVSSLFLS